MINKLYFYQLIIQNSMVNNNYLYFGLQTPEELEKHVKAVIKENLDAMADVNAENGISNFGVQWIRSNDAAIEILKEFDLDPKAPAVKAVSSSIVLAVLETLLN
jgi:hypothetical protein